MPYQVGDIRKIESVQSTFMRLVYRKLNIKYESYKHHLSFFNLDTLEVRKIKYDLIHIFKIIHNLIDLQFDDFFSISPSLKLYQLRRHESHLNKPVPPATLIKVYFFLYRTIGLCNQLPSEIDMSECCLKRSWIVIVLPTLSFLNCDFFLYFILLMFYVIIYCYMLWINIRSIKIQTAQHNFEILMIKWFKIL